MTRAGRAGINSSDTVPDVSIIIPVYNTEDYVEQAVRSILGQSLTTIEIICIDDASTDRSADTLSALASEDSRITLTKLGRNGGAGAARNAGVLRARGRYVYFFDSDDELDRTALTQLVDRADRDRLNVLYFDAVPFSDDADAGIDGFARYYRRDHRHDGVMSGIDMYTSMSRVDEWLPSVPLQLFDRQWLSAVGVEFDTNVFHEDQAFSLKTAFSADRVGYEPVGAFRRRLRDGSVMHLMPTARHVLGLVRAVAFMDELDDSRARGYDPDTSLALSQQREELFDDALGKYMRLALPERALYDGTTPLSRREAVVRELIVAKVEAIQLRELMSEHDSRESASPSRLRRLFCR